MSQFFLHKTFDNGKISNKINEGLQSFIISKTGTRSLLNNYRPILVLTSTYKVASKTLANRVQGYLLWWIRPTQIGFVKDKSILNNVFLTYESMQWAKESKYDLMILLLDFEKEYDRMN